MEELIARTLQLFLALAGAWAVALWFALVVWAYRDITARSANIATHILSTLLVVLFFVPGAIIYLILRPRETLNEAIQRSLEEEYLFQDMSDFPACPTCRSAVRDEFLFCPHCSEELRLGCVNCRRLLDRRWSACPYCGVAQDKAQVTAVAPQVPEHIETVAARTSSAPAPRKRAPRSGARVAAQTTPSVAISDVPPTNGTIREEPGDATVGKNPGADEGGVVNDQKRIEPAKVRSRAARGRGSAPLPGESGS